MKKYLEKALALLLSAALLCAPAAGLAEEGRGYPDNESCEKLLAFWLQEDENGMTNGEAVYDIDWSLGPEHYHLFGGQYPTYDGSWWTHLVFEDVLPDGFMFLFGYRVSYWMSEELEDGSVIYADGWEYAFPDLHGDLDLAGTNVTYVAPGYFADYGDGVSTHIESVELDNCALLTNVRLVGQERLISVSALDCGALADFEVKDCAAERIDFMTNALDAPIFLRALGPGAVGAEFRPGFGAVYAYPAGETFLGWYENGVCVSRARTYLRSSGGRLTAVFGGDVSGDGAVDASDALLVMRFSMGICELAVPDSADLNGSGAPDTADAVAILRFAMGIL
jgi:hypothetical protein